MLMMMNDRKNVRFFVDPRPFAFRRRRQAGGSCTVQPSRRGPSLACLAIRA